MSREAPPYIGATGFTTGSEVAQALAAVPNHSTHRLMVGVLVGYTRLPPPNQLSQIFSPDKRALNLIHYCIGEDEQTPLNGVMEAREMGGQHCHGTQINHPWPEVEMLKVYRTVYPEDLLVMQISRAAITETGSMNKLLYKLTKYHKLFDYVLVDFSRGRGLPFDSDATVERLGAINISHGQYFQLVVAGGLGPDTLEPIERMAQLWPTLSIDAEGQLRNPQNQLDMTKVTAYLQRAFRIFDEE